MSRLEERAADAGRAWVADVRLRLHEDGRRVAGGWPGTVSEAHTRVAHVLGAEHTLSHEERSHLTSILYGAAKEQWLSSRETASED